MSKKIFLSDEKIATNEAPGSRAEALQEMFKAEIHRPAIVGFSTFTFKLFILVLLTAMLGGFLAGLIRDNVLDIYGQRPYLDGTALVNSNKSPEVLDLDFLLKEQDNAYSEVLGKLRSQLIGFYKARSAENILDSLYLENDFLGSGVVATSDGWLLTHQAVLPSTSLVLGLAKMEGVVAVTADKKIYALQKRIVDPFSGLVLVKIEAQGLSPVKFADVGAVPATQALIVARYSIQNHGSDLVKSYIRKFGYHDQSRGADFLLTTESIDRYLKMSAAFDDVYNGAAIINDRNEVAGLLFNSGRDQIDLGIPAFYLRTAINNFLSASDKILRSSLGVNYLDLSETLGLPPTVTEGRIRGAVLIGDAKRSVLAVAADSPAAKAGLTAGDIILKINNEEINERNSLTKLVQDYTPGKEITLTILRKGSEQEIKVILGEL